jgi:hypothetical protein
MGTRSLTTNGVGIRRQDRGVPVAVAPRIVSGELWERIEPLRPIVQVLAIASALMSKPRLNVAARA